MEMAEGGIDGNTFAVTVTNNDTFAAAPTSYRIWSTGPHLALLAPLNGWICTGSPQPGGSPARYSCNYPEPLAPGATTPTLNFVRDHMPCGTSQEFFLEMATPYPVTSTSSWAAGVPCPYTGPTTTTTTTSVPPNSGGLVVDLGLTITQGEPGTSGRVIHVTNHGPNPVGPGIVVTVFPNSGTVVATPGWPCVQVDPDVHVADEYYVCTSTVALAPGQTADLPAVFMFFYGSAQVEPWAGEINLSNNSAACTPECS